MLLRQRFLQTNWVPYPSLPVGSLKSILVWGRLFHSGSWYLRRQGQADVHLDLNRALWREVRGTDHLMIPPPNQVLQEHDLVCVELPQSSEEPWLIQLLAPSLGSAVKTDLEFHTSRQWHQFLKSIRNYFDIQGFIETPTPTLVRCPGTEPFLQPFITSLQVGSQRERRYLPFSPELHLKKLLTLGWEKIYEIKSCYRNDEESPKHQPEFLMLEWYRAYEGLATLISDVQNLLEDCCQKLQLCQGENLKIRVISVSELFKNGFEFDLQPSTSREQLIELAKQEDIEVQENDSWDDIFFRLFIERIEWDLGWTQPIAVCDYPRSQAALARVNTRGWAERFEIYWKGLELANAFHELNDPQEQRMRIEEDLALRKKLGKEMLEVDSDFLQALDYGMPPSSGIALGLERLFMALTGIADIKKIRAFPEMGD